MVYALLFDIFFFFIAIFFVESLIRRIKGSEKEQLNLLSKASVLSVPVFLFVFWFDDNIPLGLKTINTIIATIGFAAGMACWVIIIPSAKCSAPLWGAGDHAGRPYEAPPIVYYVRRVLCGPFLSYLSSLSSLDSLLRRRPCL